MTLIVAGIKTAADLYIGWSFTRALNFLNPQSGVAWGWAVAVVLLLTYLLPLAGLIHYGIGSNPNLLSYPRALFYLFWGGFALSFQLLSWVFITDVLKIAVNSGFGINAPFVDKGYAFLVIGLSVIMLLYTSVKMYRHTTEIRIETVEHDVEGLPPALEGFRIAHITDIQADEFTGEEKVARYIDRVNEQQPDMIVFTGDLITSGTRYIPMAARQLSRLEAPYGTYFIIGDHDFWAGKEHVKGVVEQYDGITVLDGGNATVEVNGTGIRLTGITNVYSRNAQPAEVSALTGDTTRAPVKILASHQVSDLLVENAAGNGYELILGGHTHGGQLRVPVFFKKVSASNFETPYIQGRYREQGMLININNGLGFTLAPVRYNAPANISILELKGE